MSKSELSITPGWLSIADAARYVGVAESVIRAAVAAGDLTSYKRPCITSTKNGAPFQLTTTASKRVAQRISVEDLDAWVRLTWAPVEISLSSTRAV